MIPVDLSGRTAIVTGGGQGLGAAAAAVGLFGQSNCAAAKAGVILFLCSDLAAYVTGQTLHANGGWWG